MIQEDVVQNAKRTHGIGEYPLVLLGDFRVCFTSEVATSSIRNDFLPQALPEASGAFTLATFPRSFKWHHFLFNSKVFQVVLGSRGAQTGLKSLKKIKTKNNQKIINSRTQIQNRLNNKTQKKNSKTTQKQTQKNSKKTQKTQKQLKKTQKQLKNHV